MKEETFKNKILWYNFIMCLLVVCIHAQNMHIFLEPVPWINHSISFFVERIACLAVPGFLCVLDICFTEISRGKKYQRN